MVLTLHAIKDCKNDKTSNIRIDLIDDSPFHLKGSFPGPSETPYEGGHFEVVSLICTFCDQNTPNVSFSRTL
jgi:ubiquitin-protein ligase